MIVYLISKNDNNIINEFHNVINFTPNSVEFLNGGFSSKIYCDLEREYFSDIAPASQEQEKE